jgi:hypothetical protein
MGWSSPNEKDSIRPGIRILYRLCAITNGFLFAHPHDSRERFGIRSHELIACSSLVRIERAGRQGQALFHLEPIEAFHVQLAGFETTTQLSLYRMR